MPTIRSGHDDDDLAARFIGPVDRDRAERWCVYGNALWWAGAPCEADAKKATRLMADIMTAMGSRARVTVGVPTFNRADLLRDTILSILQQSYCDFRLLICDNASDDDTSAIVSSFNDARIDYVRSDENLGMNANLNRVIELASTEYLAVVPDDDLLYPDHLRMAVEVLDHNPNVGFVHTAFDVIDESGQVLERNRLLVPVKSVVAIESSDDFLERAMQSTWTVHWGSALFRRTALIDAHGFRAEDAPLADLPLLLRVGRKWDVACISEPLAAFRVHAGSTTAAVGSYTGRGYDLSDRGPDIRYSQRLRFLAESDIRTRQVKHHRSLAARALRRDRVLCVAAEGGAGIPWAGTWKRLAKLVQEDPRTLLIPTSWRICAAQLGGRRAKRVLNSLNTRRRAGSAKAHNLDVL